MLLCSQCLSSCPSSPCEFSLSSSLCCSLSLCWFVCSVLILTSLLLSSCLHPVCLCFFPCPCALHVFCICSPRIYASFGFRYLDQLFVTCLFCLVSFSTVFQLSLKLTCCCGSVCFHVCVCFCVPTRNAATIAKILYTVYGMNCPSKRYMIKKINCLNIVITCG